MILLNNFLIKKLKVFLLGFLCFISVHLWSQPLKSSLQYKWVSNTQNIINLDTLIHYSASFALNISDYNHTYLEKIIKEGKQWRNATDSMKADSIVNRIAMHFFNELAYGNKKPVLGYEGVSFKLNTINVADLLTTYLKRNGLNKLVQLLNTSSPEVKIILDTLNRLQLASNKNRNKIQLLIKAANEYKWLHAISLNQRVILVNIPSAQLKVYEENKIILNMKVILGKLTTPTNTLSSTVHQIIFNPYWVVPKSIAIKEMLPKIIEDKNYLDRNHLQVLNSNYRLTNPNNINWNILNAENFPFTIRQSTGCDNSLGVLKLNFDSPYGIYLHDTPEKSLFNYTNRFFSHGCMRMEKPIEMAKLLMEKNQKALDTIDLENCNKNPDPIIITLPTTVPLIVWYSLIDIDSGGSIKFYKDVYHRNTY